MKTEEDESWMTQLRPKRGTSSVWGRTPTEERVAFARRARVRVIQEVVQGPLGLVMGTEEKMRLHNGAPFTC